MRFIDDQLKPLKEEFCREKMWGGAYLSQENKPKRLRTHQSVVTKCELITPEEMESIGKTITSAKKLKMFYIRVSGSGATQITEEKYHIEKKIAPAHWKYVVGHFNEVRIALNKLGVQIDKLK